MTLIDLIYASEPSYITTSAVIQFGIGDHFGIFASRASNQTKKGRQDHLMIEYRDFKAFHESKFLEDVDSAPWSLIDIFYEINDKVDIFYQLINELLDWHAPKRQKKEYLKSPTPGLLAKLLNVSGKNLMHFSYFSGIKQIKLGYFTNK